METEDWQLLEAYRRDRSEEAFGRLVARHGDFVFSTALRRTGDHHLAEEVTQAVFIVLFRRLRDVRREASLRAWLHRTAGYAAANALKSRTRRQKHERSAGRPDASTVRPTTQSDLAVALDEALEHLRPRDREVIGLYYFEQRGLSETARRLAVSPDAAKKRLERAMRRLREMLGRRGVSAPAGAIAAALGATATPAVAQVPPVASPDHADNGSSAFNLAEGVIHMIKLSQLGKVAAVLVVATLCFVGSVAVLALNEHVPPESVAREDEASARAMLRQAAAASDWTRDAHVQVRFHTTITRPDDDEIVQPQVIEGVTEVYASNERLRLIKQNLPEDEAMRFEILVTPERRIFWQSNSHVQYTEEGALIEDAASLDRTLVSAGWVLNGTIALDEEHPVFDLLTAARVGEIDPVVREERLGELVCQVVKANGDGWSLEVWVAPQRGHNIARYILSSDAAPEITRTRRQFVVEDIAHRQLPDGTWVVAGGTLRWDHFPDPEQPWRQMRGETTLQRTTIDPSPDFERLGAFELPRIPDGTAVLLRELDDEGDAVMWQGQHIWKAGEVVRADGR